MNDNILLLLGFDLNSSFDEINSKIEEKIKECRKNWIDNQRDLKKGRLYTEYVSKYSKICSIKDIYDNRNDIDDYVKDDQRRYKEYQRKDIENQRKVAKEIVNSKIDFFLVSGVDILEEDIPKIAERANKKLKENNIYSYNISAKYVENYIKKVKNIKIEASKDKVDYKEIYNKYYKKGPEGKEGYKSSELFLVSLDKKSFYDFLDIPVKDNEICRESCDRLKQKTQQKKDYYLELSKTRNNDEVSAGKKVCSGCELAFKDSKSKDNYDAYLSWMKRREILDNFKERVFGDVPKALADDCKQRLVKQLPEGKEADKIAENLLVAYCNEKKISYKGSESSSSAKKRICRNCRRINDSTRDICENCGTDLIIKCPKCGTEIETGSNFCSKCHFDAHKIDLALLRYEQAEDAIRILNYKLSDELLKEAKYLWINKNKITHIKKLKEDSKKIYGTLPDDLKEAVSAKEFFKAKKLYAQLQKKVSVYEDKDLESQINHAISKSESYYNQSIKVSKFSSETEILEICSKANKVCTDNPLILELVRKYPPKPPKNLSVISDGIRKINMLSWEKSNSDGFIYYLVIRKENSVPLNKSDGMRIGRVSTLSINDTYVQPGVFYYYSIFAERAGILSSPLTNNETPAVNLFEIEDVTITPGDKKLQINWKAVPRNCGINLYRSSESKKETKLTVSNLSGYIDYGLINDISYTYRIQLVYPVGGKTQSTKGVTVSAKPTSPPPSIDNFTVEHVKDDQFQILFKNPKNLHIKFYTSDKKPDIIIGEVITVANLESKMKELQVNIRGDTASFRYNGSDVIYITAVFEKSGVVKIGRIARVRKGDSVIIKSVSDVNGKITINLTPPNNATGFVVLYRFDQFPSDLSDNMAKKVYLPFAHYKHNGALILDSPEEKDYYISVFAEFKDDGKCEYSSSADYLFKHGSKETLIYSVYVSKKLFVGSKLNIEFKSEDNNSFELPEIEIYSSIGRVPMFKSSGSIMHKIESQSVNGVLKIDIPLPKNLEKNTYIKPFLCDDKLYDNFELKMKFNTNLKIS